MGLVEIQTRIKLEKYLEGEETSSIRDEYIDGQIYALVGASANHHGIALNLRGLIEVTSPHAERIDYYKKRLAYQLIPTLQEYAIVAQDKVPVDVSANSVVQVG
jgi:Uma2 family endonuclease